MPTIEARADDEHGFVRPYIAFVDGKPLLNKLGAVRTFATESAAIKAARKEVSRGQ